MNRVERIVADLLPLTEFYADEGPEIEEVAEEEIPEPYRALLVHDNDMTPTLEEFFGGEIHLRILDWRIENEVLSREVALVLNHEERPVEFGAIRIHLERFGEGPREAILEGYRPLGAILRAYQIGHRSHPTGFFLIHADPTITDALAIEEASRLYGRCNRLTYANGDPLAEVVEIVPPLQGESGGVV